MNREATGLAVTRHIAYETLGSTNAEALARLRAGERGPLWITARAQTAGRGRRGSVWVSPVGNLHASLLLSEPSALRQAPQLSFVAALAVHDALCACAPIVKRRLKVKWPNDLLLDAKKIAGILIESENEPVFAAVIGIGINCISHPIETLHPATDLAAAGLDVSPKQVFAALSGAMTRRLDQWQGGQGFTAIRAGWLKRAAGLGQNIRVRLPERELAGCFDGLDEAGHLLLAGPDGIEAIAAGEVFGL